MISFTAANVERFLAEDNGEPVVMLNLLRCRPDIPSGWPADTQVAGSIACRTPSSRSYAVMAYCHRRT